MTRRSDHENLLSDALADDMPPDFREALLSDTLRRVRFRRRVRVAGRGALALACVAFLAVLVTLNLPRSSPRAISSTPGYRLVRTQKLPVASIVESVPFVPAEPAVSASFFNVETAVYGDGYHEMTDEELLALVAPRQGALVGCGPNCAQLVFVNPADERGFPLN